MQVRLRFGLVPRKPSAEIVSAEACRGHKMHCVLDLPHATLCRDRACRGREMQVRLRLDLSRATLCEDRACRGREMQVRLRFGLVARNPLGGDRACGGRETQVRLLFELVALHFWRKSRTKRPFWRLGASLLEEVSCETLLLETWCFTFGGSLVRNARFGDLALHVWRKSRTKRSFWRLPNRPA